MIKFNGTALRKARGEAGLSQEDLAWAISISDGCIVSSWEVERRAPRIPYINRIAAFFKRPVSDFLIFDAPLAPIFVKYPAFSKKALQIALAEKGLSMRDVEREIGVKAATLYNWVSGRNTPRMESIAAISEALGKPAVFFLEENTGRGHD